MREYQSMHRNAEKWGWGYNAVCRSGMKKTKRKIQKHNFDQASAPSSPRTHATLLLCIDLGLSSGSGSRRLLLIFL